MTYFLKLFSFAVFLLVPVSLQSQIKVVEINASALVEDKTTNNYSIVIFADGVKKDSIFNKKTKSITLSLDINTLYSVVFKKDGFSDKIVIVNTQIPSGLKELVEDPFELQVEMTPNTTTLNKDLYDYPVAVLQVVRKVKSLMASEAYHKFTHN